MAMTSIKRVSDPSFAHQTAFAFVCASVLLFSLFVFVPSAHAGLFPGVDDIVSFVLNSIIKPPLEWLLGTVWGLLLSLTPSGVLTGSWGNLLGDPATGGTSVYSMANTVNDTLVKPIAYSVLAFGMLIQLIQIASKADQDAAMPMLKELIMLAMYYVCFRFLISHSFELCETVYNDINAITAGIGPGVIQDTTLTIGNLDDFGQAVGVFLSVILLWLIVVIAWVVTLLMAYARAVQLYIFSAFAPIPLALLGIEQTRSFGIGFIKNFVALCLAGAIMLFTLFAFPTVVNTCLATGSVSTSFLPGGAGDPTTAAVGLVQGPFMLIVLCLLLIFIMVKSGGIARSILGE